MTKAQRKLSALGVLGINGRGAYRLAHVAIYPFTKNPKRTAKEMVELIPASYLPDVLVCLLRGLAVEHRIDYTQVAPHFPKQKAFIVAAGKLLAVK